MHFIIVNTDRDDGIELRNQTREAHLAYLRDHGKEVRLLMAGPTPSEDGSRVTGSLIVVEGDTIETVRDFAAADPYSQAGLFADVEVRPWNWTVGNPDGPR
ncbi:MAG: YciI family protein [Alphaproteobacteria bacterium]